MRFSAAGTQTTAKTSARGPTIVAGASQAISVHEVGIESTTAVSSQVALRFITTAGTPGTALDEVTWFLGQTAASAASATQAPTTYHTLVAGNIRIAHLPAAIGGGVIWTFGPMGLVIPEGTGNGLCLTLPGGSDAIINFYWDYEE